MLHCIDAVSFSYRVILAEEDCYDRSEASHAVSSCDMHAKYADVVPTAEILSYFNELPAELVRFADRQKRSCVADQEAAD